LLLVQAGRAQAQLLKLRTLSFEHAREHLTDAVVGVGEPVAEAGEEGSEDTAGEAGLTGLFRAAVWYSRDS
jgi:hypothetical protein